MLKNLVFDMGGVLINLNKQACIDAFVNLGFTDVERYVSEFTQSDLFFRLEEGTISVDEFIRTISSLLGNGVTAVDVQNAWMAFLLSIPPLKLQQLRSLRKHYRVFMLSNTNAIHFPYICATQFCAGGHTMDEYFEKCYLSYELHLAKPNAAIFQHVIDDAHLVPEETLLIDDGEANIKAAASLGWQVYHAQPFEDFTPLYNRLINNTI